MNIIDLIVTIWFIAVGIVALFIIGERSVSKWPNTSFAKWWRKHIASMLNSEDEMF
jgi:hypothetical protein